MWPDTIICTDAGRSPIPAEPGADRGHQNVAAQKKLKPSRNRGTIRRADDRNGQALKLREHTLFECRRLDEALWTVLQKSLKFEQVAACRKYTCRGRSQ
jgi:hypothetical protein